jgi:peptide/nickel transport system substrate-binding protein
VVNVPPFNDIKVREAVQEAINVPLIASNNYPGSSGLPESMTSNILTGWGYPYSQWPASLQQIYAYNPTQSKQLLAQAGYPNGINTTCEAENTADLNMLQIVKSYLSAVGINMTIQTMDEASWTDLVQTNKKAVGFSYKYWGGLDYSFPPIDQLGIYATGATFNTSIISDSIIDNANTKANTATASLDDVRAACIAVNQEMAQQVYVISLLTPVTHNFQQPSLKGFDAQSGSIPEGTNSGALVGFYAARFWKSQ